MVKSVGKNAHNKVRAQQCFDNALLLQIFAEEKCPCFLERERERRGHIICYKNSSGKCDIANKELYEYMRTHFFLKNKPAVYS